MKADLFAYYEDELSFIKEMSKEFSRKYSGPAGRLQLEAGRCEDPHVERLLEGFALLAGRIRHKIDDEFPEVSESLLSILYPHYLRPVPSMAIAQFELDAEQGKASTAFTIERNREVTTAAVEGGRSCRFRTCYPVTLWPLRITSVHAPPPAALGLGAAAPEAVAAIRLQVQCLGGASLSELGLSELRFHLSTERYTTAHTLYELIMNNAYRVLLRGDAESTGIADAVFPASCIHTVGFEEDEALLPYPERSFPGYRLLQEYFCFPRKFLFFDLKGFDRLPLERFGTRFEIVFLLKEFERKDRLRVLEQGLRADDFRLGCTPIVNLFSRGAEPIRLAQTTTEYRVIADLYSPDATEVYSVDEVSSTPKFQQKPRVYEPFYSLRHTYRDDQATAFWYSRRRSSEKKEDNGTEVFISLVDLDFRPARPAAETLTVQVTCTNRDLPARLPIAERFGELSLQTGSGVRARCLGKMSEPVRLNLRSSLQWRLISHLSLNYLSLVEGGREALQEILGLYNFSETPAIRDEIASITRVSSEPHLTRMLTAHGVVFCLGLRVNLEFDEDHFVHGGVFLMASVLERFLGLYSSINSFSQLRVTTRQRREVLREWQPRAGNRILL